MSLPSNDFLLLVVPILGPFCFVSGLAIGGGGEESVDAGTDATATSVGSSPPSSPLPLGVCSAVTFLAAFLFLVPFGRPLFFGPSAEAAGAAAALEAARASAAAANFAREVSWTGWNLIR